MSSSLVFCVGPLTVLGSISDGLGQGPQQLILEATLDGFAAAAFRRVLRMGVAAAALAVLAVQGSLTVVGAILGEFLGAAEVSALSATGGLLLVGVALRLLRVRDIPAADLLPALVVAPALVAVIAPLR